MLRRFDVIEENGKMLSIKMIIVAVQVT